jgi:hypothetical protein
MPMYKLQVAAEAAIHLSLPSTGEPETGNAKRYSRNRG